MDFFDFLASICISINYRASNLPLSKLDVHLMIASASSLFIYVSDTSATKRIEHGICEIISLSEVCNSSNLDKSQPMAM